MALGAGPGEEANWPVMVPPDRRITSEQFASTSGVSAAITHEPTSSPACLPFTDSWSLKTISSPKAKGKCGSRTLLAATTDSGLKATWKCSTLDRALVGSDACDTAEVVTTAPSPSNRAVIPPVRASLRMIFRLYSDTFRGRAPWVIRQSTLGALVGGCPYFVASRMTTQHHRSPSSGRDHRSRRRG